VVERLVLLQQLQFLLEFRHARTQFIHFALQFVAVLRLGQGFQLALQPRRILMGDEGRSNGTARTGGLECHES